MSKEIKQFRHYGYDIIINNFEPLLREFIKNEILVKNYGEFWKDYIPKRVIEFLENYRRISFDQLDDMDEFFEEISLPNLKWIILKKENFVLGENFLGEIEPSKFSRLMNIINRARIKIAHAKSSYSYVDFSKTVESLKEICVGNYTAGFIEYLNKENYSQAKGIPDGFFEDYNCQNNLPIEDYDLEGGFVGRVDEIDNIVGHINSKQDRIFTLTGAGGTGKTAIALKIAYLFLEDDEQLFEAIIWFSAKMNKLTEEGIISIEPQISDSQKLIEEMLNVLDPYQTEIFKNAGVPIESWIKHIYNIFRSQRCLIVIDNLETIYTNQNVINFITEIPRPSCVLITSRRGLGKIERPIPIGDLKENDAAELFKLVSKSKGLEDLVQLNEEEVLKLVKKVKCYPLLIKWSIGQYRLGKSLNEAFSEILTGNSEIAIFSFNDIFDILSNDAKKILFSLIIFGQQGVTRYLIQHLTLLSENDFESAIRELILTSLVYLESIQEENQTRTFYYILSLTRGFIETKLNEDKQTKLFLLNRYNDHIQELEKSIAVYHQTVFSLGIKTVEEKVAFNSIKSAKSYIENDQEEKAEECFKKAAKIAPNLDYVWTEFSKFEYLRKNHQKSLEYAKIATRLGSDNFHTWWNYGTLLRKTGNYHEAIEILKQAKIVNSDYLPIYTELGLTFSTLGLFELAEKEFLQALTEEKKPNFKHKMYTLVYHAENYRKWANIFRMRNDFDGELEILNKAETSINKAIDINPAHGFALKIYRQVNLSIGNALGFKNDPICFDHFNKAKDEIPLKLSTNKAHNSLISKIEKKIDFFQKRINKTIKQKEIEEIPIQKAITDYRSNFKDSINILLEVLEKAGIQGKSIRFIVLDAIMRRHSGGKYMGAKSVIRPDTESNFKSFTDFINYCEQENLVKSEINDGFKEIFLEEKDIEKNNEDLTSQISNQSITKAHWKLIIDKVIDSFEFFDAEDAKFGRFLVILKYIRTLKKENLAPYSNRQLRTALEDIIEVDFLIKQEDGSYRLAIDAKEIIGEFIEKLFKKQIEEL